jgi:hypothetical protein
MPSGDWFQWLDQDVQLRTRMTLDRQGHVIQFTVQLEVWLKKWCPVVRYDAAHGEAHIDYIDPRGQIFEKLWLNVRAPYNVVMTQAEAELKLDFASHVERFRRQQEAK